MWPNKLEIDLLIQDEWRPFIESEDIKEKWRKLSTGATVPLVNSAWVRLLDKDKFVSYVNEGHPQPPSIHKIPELPNKLRISFPYKVNDEQKTWEITVTHPNILP